MTISSPIRRVLYVEGVGGAAPSMYAKLVSVPQWPLEMRRFRTLDDLLSRFHHVDDTVLIAVHDEVDLPAIRKLRAERNSAPVVAITQNRDMSFALQLADSGATMSFIQDEISIESLARQLYLLSCRNERSRYLAYDFEQIFSTAISGSNECIWDWDISSNTTRCFSPSVINESGYEQSDFGHSFERWLSSVHPDDVERVMAAIDQHLVTGGMYETEYRFRQESGEYCWLLVRGYCNRDDRGRPVRFTGTTRNITERKRAEEQEKRLLLLEQQREFLATLTHDLKMPLIGAGRIYDLALDGAFGALSAEQSSIVEGLRTSNSQLLEMIQNHIELYRLEQISYLRHPAQLDLNDLVGGLCAYYATINASRDIRLTCERDPELYSIMGDESAMRRLIHNLLGNATKFTQPGGTIEVRVSNTANGITLCVKDSGPGIPPDELDSIYQRLYQGTVGKYSSDSCGLGLYVCKRIVEVHGGTISCASEPGKGTAFFVNLPCSVRAPGVGVL